MIGHTLVRLKKGWKGIGATAVARCALLSLLLLGAVPQFVCAAAVPLPQTGQKTCYDEAGTEIPCPGTRQDGELQLGVISPTPRFTDNGDGTVTDNLTGLIWLRNAGCYLDMPWLDALAKAKELADGQCGLSDHSVPGQWRVPNIVELESLVDLSRINPALPSGHPFLNVANAGYWSSTTNAFHPLKARYVHFRNGAVNGSSKIPEPLNNGLTIWPVRGGQ